MEDVFLTQFVLRLVEHIRRTQAVLAYKMHKGISLWRIQVQPSVREAFYSGFCFPLMWNTWCASAESPAEFFSENKNIAGFDNVSIVMFRSAQLPLLMQRMRTSLKVMPDLIIRSWFGRNFSFKICTYVKNPWVMFHSLGRVFTQRCESWWKIHWTLRNPLASFLPSKWPCKLLIALCLYLQTTKWTSLVNLNSTLRLSKVGGLSQLQDAVVWPILLLLPFPSLSLFLSNRQDFFAIVSTILLYRICWCFWESNGVEEGLSYSHSRVDYPWPSSF